MFSFKLNSKDFNWKLVEYVQSCVKDPVGIGKAIYFHFFAPLNEESQESADLEIDYSSKSMPDDLQLLIDSKYTEYIKKQCLKISHYLQKVRSIEILQMKVEFLIDENKNLWFSYAKDIHIRRVKKKNLIMSDPKVMQESMDAYENLNRQHLANELAEYEISLQNEQAAVVGEKKVAPKNKMLLIMEDYYDKIKNDAGIDPEFQIQKDDSNLDNLVLKLQPNSTAINFKEFFTKSKNLFKTTPWKQISRRVIEEDKRRRIKSSVGRATSQLNQKFFVNRKSISGVN